MNYLPLLASLALSSDPVIENRWTPTKYVWNLAITSTCDINTLSDPKEYFLEGYYFDTDIYRTIKWGDVVWIKCCYVNRFAKEVLPDIKVPFVLLINDGDDSFPSNCGDDFDVEAFIHHRNLLHVFAQNCDYQGPSNKISPIPIGIDFHTNAFKRWTCDKKASVAEQELGLIQVLSELKPTFLRKKKAFVDFQLNDTLRGNFERHLQFGEDRTAIFQQLLKTGLIDHSTWMKRGDLWKTKGEYAFSICPHGNGLDTHRAWEDLVLGCIVIVKTSPLDPLYQNLPVVIVQSWDEITEENLNLWLETYKDAFTCPHYREKLTNAYWIGVINQAARSWTLDKEMFREKSLLELEQIQNDSNNFLDKFSYLLYDNLFN